MKNQIALLFLLSYTSLFSVPNNWTAGGSSNWDANINWSSGVFPNAVDEIATFLNGPPAPIGPTIITLGANITVGTIQFDFNFPYTIQSPGLKTLTFDVSSGSAALDITNVNGNAAHKITCNIFLNSPLIVTQGSTTAFQISSVIGETGGSQSLTKQGSDTLILAGNNSYSGGTFINQGTLQIASDAKLGALTGSLSIGNGTLVVTGNIPSTSPSNRSGSFTGAATIDTQGNTVALAGSFNGSGSLTKLGVGTLILTGNNSYSGPTTISAGSVQGNSNSLPGDIVVNGSLTFNQSSDGIYTGALSGAGTLTKTGAGKLEVKGSSSGFTGPINLTQGELKVNSSLANSGTLTTSANTILSGIGSIGPTVVGGTIHPGNSIGTITVASLSFSPGAAAIFDLNPSTSSQIIVTGPANLTNGNVTIIPEPGFYGFTHSYTLVTSTGLAGTQFASYTTTDPSFIASLSYTSTDAILSLQVANPFLDPYPNSNIESVANNLTQLFAAGQLTGELLDVVNELAGQNLDDVYESLDELHPALYSGVNELQTENNAKLISFFHRYPALTCECSDPWRFWAKPSFNALEIKKDDEQVGFNATTGGLALGCDQSLTDTITLGIGGAWNRANLHWKEHRGSTQINGFYGSAYSDCQVDQFYLGAAILAGVDFCDTSRHIPFASRTAKVDYHTLDITAQLTTAYFFDISNLWLYPYATVDFLYLNTGDLHEQGASELDLNVESRTASTIRTELGLTLERQGRYVGDCQEVCVSPFLSLGWVNMTPIQRPDFKATFAGTTIPFTTEGWDHTWNLISLDLGIKVSYNNFVFNLEYDLEASPTKPLLLDQQGTLTFSWKW